MRKIYSESSEYSPSSRLLGWLVDRAWRMIVTIVLAIFAYFLVDGAIFAINFIQAAGETGVVIFMPDPFIVGMVRYGLIGLIIYLILFKRV